MKKIILFLLFMTNVFANALVDTYRQEGIEAVKDQIQQLLQDKDYWQKKLQYHDLHLGYYEDAKRVLVTNKAKKSLHVYGIQENKTHLVNEYDVIVGANGDKQKEGDLKTPLGVYTITKRFVPSDPFYGPKAFALSYPNILDRVQGKNGYGIWIHGSPLDGSYRDPMSKGCIVLDNETLLHLEKDIDADGVITIVNENGMDEVNINQVSILLSNLFRWQDAWRDNRTTEYLDFYHDDFIRYDGMKRKKFSRMKKQIFSRAQQKSIRFSKINISPYPNEENKTLFKIAFYEDYESKTHRFRGNKQLFVHLQGETFKILSER